MITAHPTNPGPNAATDRPAAANSTSSTLGPSLAPSFAPMPSAPPHSLHAAALAMLEVLEAVRATHPELIADHAPAGWGMTAFRAALATARHADAQVPGVSASTAATPCQAHPKATAAPSGLVWQAYPCSGAGNEGCVVNYCADGDGLTVVSVWDGQREEFDFLTNTTTVPAAGIYLRSDSAAGVIRLADDLHTAVLQADCWLRDNEFYTWCWLGGRGRFELALQAGGASVVKLPITVDSNDVLSKVRVDEPHPCSGAAPAAQPAVPEAVLAEVFDRIEGGHLAGDVKHLEGVWIWTLKALDDTPAPEVAGAVPA